MRRESVTAFKHRAAEIIDGLAEHQQPILITHHGQPAAYLVGVETFARMGKKLEILEGVARGEKSIQEARLVPHQDAKRRMARWLE